MSRQGPNLEPEMLRRLIEAAGASAPVDGDKVEAADYDWSAPRVFTPSQLQKLEEFTKLAAEGMSRGLTALFRCDDVVVQAAGLTQHYASNLRASAAELAEYCVPISNEGGRQCGLITLPAANAVEWVGRRLGNPAVDAAGGRELSDLENDLLLDIARVLTEAFSEVSRQSGGGAFRHVEKISKGDYDLPGGDGEPYLKMAFRPGESEANSAVSFIVGGDVLEPLAATAAQGGGLSAEDVRRALLGHLEQASVIATAELGNAAVTMREIMSLETGDVVLIQKKVGEPMELAVQGRKVLSGFPVKSSGRYAVRVAALPGPAEEA